MQQVRIIPLMDKVRYVGYGVIAGLVLGAVLGWWFHAWVGFLVRLAFVLLLLVPLVLAIVFWKRVTSRPAAPAYEAEPPAPVRRQRVDAAPVREAEWVELEAPRQTRR